jgi:monofunctional chorismate mutase
MKTIEELRLEINKIDEEMANLFNKRMEAAKNIALYKKEFNLPIFDKERELQLLNKNLEYVQDDLKPLYREFLIKLMELSKLYQQFINQDK